MNAQDKCIECQEVVGTRRFCTNCGKENPKFKETSYDETENSKVIFTRTLYPYCLLSCIACSPVKIKVTTKRIDTASGCCFGNEDTLDLRRVKDIGFDRSCFQMCINRGTITICAADETHSELRVSCFGAKKVFNELRTIWNQTKLGTVVE
ncbi:hypothetical protein PTSG_05059 [Salpingoeca rosetta]|uniref:Uncharacterized protein n=1 Tax=Salpingoeca rosetta (strain ATCC 50818 / BSB-021) TaxID=946362 RepID=F2U9E4_SALR5|nr:uncharacterized protein PTSG_05059 [Salpingoeca rosetta]EGD73347.1 hypothetical protein PTSG_05059 [Salpingoeca rosetta]|eukprot:XP_004994377.1 hypothetical protein PTSG_05059 [Salpingoeca rosetta]